MTAEPSPRSPACFEPNPQARPEPTLTWGWPSLALLGAYLPHAGTDIAITKDVEPARHKGRG